MILPYSMLSSSPKRPTFLQIHEEGQDNDDFYFSNFFNFLQLFYQKSNWGLPYYYCILLNIKTKQKIRRLVQSKF